MTCKSLALGLKANFPFINSVSLNHPKNKNKSPTPTPLSYNSVKEAPVCPKAGIHPSFL